jgi:hypothetical protein
MLAPLVWLVLLGGMLLSMEAGMRLHARQLRAAQSDSTGFAARSRSGVRSAGTGDRIYVFREPPVASTIAATLLLRKPTTSARRTSGSRLMDERHGALELFLHLAGLLGDDFAPQAPLLFRGAAAPLPGSSVPYRRRRSGTCRSWWPSSRPSGSAPLFRATSTDAAPLIGAAAASFCCRS